MSDLHEARVEAAAKAIADCNNPGMFERYPENWRAEARAALAAADAVKPVLRNPSTGSATVYVPRRADTGKIIREIDVPSVEQIAEVIFMSDYGHLPDAWETARLDGNDDRKRAVEAARAVRALFGEVAGDS